MILTLLKCSKYINIAILYICVLYHVLVSNAWNSINEEQNFNFKSYLAADI